MADLFFRRAAIGMLAFFAHVNSRSALDYDKAVHLDAEELAERGMQEAYHKIRPQLQSYLRDPAELLETVDPEMRQYTIRVAGLDYVISSAEIADTEAWGVATYVFFKIVNDQLNGRNIHFYALNGGNDLMGIFLTPEQAENAKCFMPKSPKDWPYLPTAEHPWYGQGH